MNYYMLNIGDFTSDVGGLDFEYQGIFINLLNRYMKTEKPIKTDWVSLRFQGETQKKATALLNSFFEEVEDGWIYAPLADFLRTYQEKADRARVNGQKGGRPKKNKNPNETQSVSSGFSNETETKADRKLTNNQEPLTNNQLINNPLTPLQGESAAAVVEPSREEKRKAPARDKGTRLEIDALPDEWRDYCLKVEPELDPQRVFEDFRDYWRSLSGAKAIKTDWRAVWQTHVRSFRNAPEWKRNPVLKKAVESKDDYLPNSRFKTQEARLKNDDYGLSEIFGEGWK